MSDSHIPQGFTNVTPQLVCKDAKATIDFIEKAFGGETNHIMPGPDGKGVMHGAVRLGNAHIFLSDANDFAKPTSSNLFVYFKDVDAAFDRAVKAGATVVAPLADMFWGDRWAMVADPFGNMWQLATKKEDVAPEEMQKRMAAQFGG